MHQLRQLIVEIIEESVEEEILEKMAEPEFKSVDSFAAAKLDDDDYEFSYVELQALARLETAKKLRLIPSRVSQPVPEVLQQIKEELVGLGFKFIGRQPSKKTRGFTSGYHGRNVFAGTGGGGSGFGNSGFTAHGGGPGAIGGGTAWNADDKRNLAMNSRSKKR